MAVLIKEVLANAENYGKERSAYDVRYLVIHYYTGNDGDTALSNAKYYRDNVPRASAHYFVDDEGAYRSVPELRTAWAVGGKKWADCAKTGGGIMYRTVTNANSISVELCDTRKDRVYGASEKTLRNAAELCREIMTRYGIPIEHVVRHFDVTGKHCPAYMMDPAAWNAFKARLVPPALDNTPAPAHKASVEWALEFGILKGNAAGDLMLRQPVTTERLCTMLYRFASYMLNELKK